MKTAITVLQELMVKLGTVPEYECISQSGPQHSATFEFRCVAGGRAVTAPARSKKEAKQEAARRMLLLLSADGLPVPPPYCLAGATQQPPAAEPEAGGGEAGPRSAVALLKDLCEEYRLPGAEYELVGDTGPPHLRQFTVRAKLGANSRLGTATTKKAARQLAAQQLYTYLRENLARLTKDFDEEDALVRAHERAMERYVELRDETVWRPDLGQKVADYHLGLFTHVDADKRGLALEALAAAERSDLDADATLHAAAAALGLGVRPEALPTDAGELAVLELAPAAPALAFAGSGRAACARTALRYLRLALQPPAAP